jgi:hypothetical protein
MQSALGKDLRDEDAEADNGFTGSACTSAKVCSIVRRLAGEGRQPKDGKEDIDSQHGMRIGEFPRALVTRRHNEIYPGDYGDENLQTPASASWSDEVRLV